MLINLITLMVLATGLVSHSAAAVEIAFVEAYKDGKLIQLEKGGRFYHVAIRVGNKWLHAHPHKGVDLVDDLKLYGHKFYYLHHDLIPGPNQAWAERQVGRPFDRKYTWDDPVATYCTRIIAEFLGIPPKRMDFAGGHWKIPGNVVHGELSSRGKVGLSPDELYEILIQLGFTPVPRCEQFLEEVL